MLWVFVVVTTSVTKAAKRKVSHQLIIREFHRQQRHYRGVKGDDSQRMDSQFFTICRKAIVTGPCMQLKELLDAANVPPVHMIKKIQGIDIFSQLLATTCWTLRRF